MKKYLLSSLVILVFAFYVVFTKGLNGSSTPPPPLLPANPIAIAQPDPAPAAPPTPTLTPKPAPKPIVRKTYIDGTYPGSPADAFYGTVQVQAVIQNGRLTDVQFLDYPSDNRHSLEVSSMSLPILKQEAIASQSANVDAVSGATQTSRAFKESLAAALAAAKA